MQLKDINNALEEAGQHELILPLTEQVKTRYTTLIEEMAEQIQIIQLCIFNCYAEWSFIAKQQKVKP